MRQELCFDSELLSEAIAGQEARLKDPASILAERGRKFEPGDIWSRRLSDYLAILGSNVRPNFLEVAHRMPANFTLVDAGCGTGLALAQMRPLFPNAHLIGIDIRNARDNRLDYGGLTPIRAGDLIDEQGVDFRRGSVLRVNEIVPEGYDIAISAGVYIDKGLFPAAEGLKLLYDGLKPGGQAFVNMRRTKGEIEQIGRCFDSIGAPFQFAKTDLEVLRKQHLVYRYGVTGTVVLGPKP